MCAAQMGSTMLDLAQRIDHTLLKPEATRSQIEQLCAEAIRYDFASVCVNGCHVAAAAEAVAASPVKVCSVVGFPLGAAVPQIKAAEAVAAIGDGAFEIDFVAHIPYLLADDLPAARAEFIGIVEAARSAEPQVIVKVIIESAVLMHEVDDAEADARIAMACQAAREAECDFVKTSTGFHSCGGATLEAVRLMSKHASGLKVKAAGGIRTLDQAVSMIDAGADRLGCSAGVDIMEALRQREHHADH